MQLNPIGMTIGCTVWSVPTGDYISKITIKYNQEIGVNYFVAQTNGGALVGRGEFDADDFTKVQSFTQEKPFIGIFGFESMVKTVDSLGFYTRLCLEILPVDVPLPVAPVVKPIIDPVVEPIVIVEPVVPVPVPVIEPVNIIETVES